MKKIIFLLASILLVLQAEGQEYKTSQHPTTKKYGFYDQNRNIVIPFKYDDASNFSNGYAGVKLNGAWGMIDSTGKTIIPCLYDNIPYMEDGVVRVKLSDKWGLYDKNGDVILYPNTYDYIYQFQEGLALVLYNKKMGYIAKNGTEVIPCKYIEAIGFSGGIAKVKLNDKRGYIDKNDNWYDNQYDYALTNFSVYAKEVVEKNMNAWQKKGEFEKIADWQKRVNESSREQKINELVKEAESSFITKHIQRLVNPKLSTYDAENETFLISYPNNVNILVHIPITEAEQFKKDWEKVEKTPERYFINNDKVSIAQMRFTTPGGKEYTYNDQASLNYTVAEITYNFEPIELNDFTSKTVQTPKEQTITQTNLTLGRSDVDINIPSSGQKNDQTFAVIIANENYRRAAKVEFANNDGKIFREYCIKTLGLPEKNIRYISDATLNDIRAGLGWVSKVADAYSGNANVIFYYAGHGIPHEISKESYLLPVDGYSSDIATSYKLSDVYATLSAAPAKSVLVFLDACFSGAQRDGNMTASTRGVAVKPKQETIDGNMIVFSAASNEEAAFPSRENGHGLFTYYLLKKIQQTQGSVTLGELAAYVTTQVKQQSIVVNNRSQTPTVIPSAKIASEWKDIKLR